MEVIKNQIRKILAADDDELIENIYLIAKAQIATDHENPYREGRFFLDAILQDDPQAMLMALCGWNITSLIKFAGGTTEENV